MIMLIMMPIIQMNSSLSVFVILLPFQQPLLLGLVLHRCQTDLVDLDNDLITILCVKAHNYLARP